MILTKSVKIVTEKVKPHKISRWAPISVGTQGSKSRAVRDIYFLVTYLLSFSFYNLNASGDYRHLSFPFCKASLPRTNLVIPYSSFCPPSKNPFPNLVHSLNQIASTDKTRRPTEERYSCSRISTSFKLCQARPFLKLGSTDKTRRPTEERYSCNGISTSFKLCQARPFLNLIKNITRMTFLIALN